MATITLKGNQIETVGSLPAVGSAAPEFTLVKTDLSEVSLKEYRGKSVVLNIFRSADFGKNYGQTITTGPLAGVLARAIVVIDAEGKVKYTEQVPEITQEPDYAAALKALTA